MILSELTEGMTWAKRGNKVVRKFRCVSGRRKSRVVSSPAQCFAAPGFGAGGACIWKFLAQKNQDIADRLLEEEGKKFKK